MTLSIVWIKKKKVEEEEEEKKKLGMLLCLDFENAVDYVRWKFMFKVSKHLGSMKIVQMDNQFLQKINLKVNSKFTS